MFQFGDNDINSYNSLSMKNKTCKPDIKSSKKFLSSKIMISSDLSSKYKNNQIISNKKVILDINNANSNVLNIENEENNNYENINKNNKSEEIDSKDKTKSSKSLTKLPKITKYAIKTNAILDSASNNNPLTSISNSIEKNINININYNSHLYYTKHQQFYNEQLKNKKHSKKRKNSLRLSGTANFESINFHKKKMSSENFNNNNNLNKKIKFKNEPKLGKMKEYIKLPDFIGEEPLTEMIFNPMLQDNLTKPQNEKQYEINLYLNSNKMLNNLIYLKIPLTKDGLIPTQNIINVKKLNKDNKYEEDEEDIIPDNQKEIIENNNPKPPPNEENVSILLPKNAAYVSISEYPGNYKSHKKIKKEKELKISQNIIEKININNNEVLDNNIIKSSRGSLNLNIYELCKRNQNNSDFYNENKSENYMSKSIHIPNGMNLGEIKTDKNENSNINNNESEININEYNKSDNEQSIQLQTIYGDIQPYYKIKNEKDKTLIFESRFESGNLLCAFKTEEENNYQLYLQNDTNTTGYIQWFFFRVSNTKKKNKVNFTIINMLRSRCVYKKGLKIMTYSKIQAQKENIGWHRDCDKIMYYTNNLYIYNENSKKKRSLKSLSFEYEFKYDNDTVYFANCLPYFYSKLTKEIDLYKNKVKNKFYFDKNIVTQTLGGNDFFALHLNSSKIQNNITSEISFPHLSQSCYQPLPNIMNSSSNSKINEEENQNSKITKKTVFLIARQHPGETVGSHVIKGCIDFLLGDSEEAQKLREIYNFQIFPIMNPDGVLVGNSRTSFAGCDLNRRWSKPNEIIHPEIFNTKSIILKTSLRENIAFIIDFHGHFGTFNSLFYCNHKENKKICSLFPYLCSKLSNIISFQQSTFSMPKYKHSTERLSLFRELEDNNNNNIVALETSFFGTRKNNEKNYYFNTKLLNDIGRDVCLGMLSYYIKYENINIEKNVNFLNNEEKIKRLDVDMREFESDLIREVNEDEDQDEEELSESEPSIDNFDKKEIMRLMPIYHKKKKRKGKNYNFNNFNRKLEKCLNKKKFRMENYNLDKNKNNDLDIELYNPLKELMIRKLEEEKKNLKINKNPSIKSGSNSYINFKKTKVTQIQNNNQNKQNQNQNQLAATEPNFKSDYTQTEEIFFRMHWTFFVGKYKILTGKKTNNNNLPNICTIPLNMAKLNNNYINPFSYSSHKKNDLVINGKIKTTNWTKFGNVFVDEKNINQILKQNGNNNIKVIKNYGIEINRNNLLKDRASIRPLYLTRFIGNNQNSNKKHNNENKISNKNSNNTKIINDNNKINKGKNSSEGKIKEEINKEKENIQD